MSKATRQRQKRGMGRHAVSVAVAVAAFAILGIGVLFITSGRTSAPDLAPGTNNVIGEATAPIQIEEWGDFQCPPCRAFAQDIERELKRAYVQTGTVRFTFKHMAFLGDESVQAAAASECAAEQGQFWAYHDRLYAEQRGRNSGTFSKHNLKLWGADLGLDTASFNACVDDDRAVARVRAETEEGRQKGVQRTPTVFINGQKIEGVPAWQDFQQLLDRLALNDSGSASARSGQILPR